MTAAELDTLAPELPAEAVETDDVLRLLGATATTLTVHGWCQGFYQGADGSHCLAGALGASFGPELDSEAYDTARCYLRAALHARGDHALFLEDWNDKRATGADDVGRLIGEAMALRRLDLLPEAK